MEMKIHRTTEMKCPFSIVAEGAVDWTHFTYIHSRSHKVFKLIQKTADRSVIFYKARVLYPFPLYNNYIVVRKELAADFGYEQVYYDTNSGKTHYLKAVTVNNGATTSIEADFIFDVNPLWKLFPQLFFFVFKLRMRRVMNEDNIYMRERVRLGTPTHNNCEVTVPENFSLLDEYKDKADLTKKFDFKDHVLTDLES